MKEKNTPGITLTRDTYLAQKLLTQQESPPQECRPTMSPCPERRVTTKRDDCVAAQLTGLPNWECGSGSQSPSELWLFEAQGPHSRHRSRFCVVCPQKSVMVCGLDEGGVKSKERVPPWIVFGDRSGKRWRACERCASGTFGECFSTAARRTAREAGLFDKGREAGRGQKRLCRGVEVRLFLSLGSLLLRRMPVRSYFRGSICLDRLMGFSGRFSIFLGDAGPVQCSAAQ